MNIGRKIKLLRQKRDLTQKQVAERLCVSPQAISKWENGANAPDISLIPRIASLFGVSIDELFDSESAEPSDGR